MIRLENLPRLTAGGSQIEIPRVRSDVVVGCALVLAIFMSIGWQVYLLCHSRGPWMAIEPSLSG
jgi:hypothetical protein